MSERVVLSIGDKVYQGSIVTAKVYERAVDSVQESRLDGGGVRRRYYLEGLYLRPAIENIVGDSECGKTFWMTEADAREALRLRWAKHAREHIEFCRGEIAKYEGEILRAGEDLAILEAGGIPDAAETY